MAYDVFINATTRQQISVYSILIILLFACSYTPASRKVGGTKNFFTHGGRFEPPTFKIAAPPLHVSAGIQQIPSFVTRRYLRKPIRASLDTAADRYSHIYSLHDRRRCVAWRHYQRSHAMPSRFPCVTVQDRDSPDDYEWPPCYK